MRLHGIILIAIATLLPVMWYAPLAGRFDAVAVFSQYLGSAALILMGLNMFIATRIPGLQTVFGPLDRIYVLHKWLGVIALIAMGLHDIIDAELRGRGVTRLLTSSPLSDIAEDIGEISLYGLMILILASVITFIPYHLWKWSHRLIGIFFFFGAFHYFFIEKPFSNFDPLGLYISAFCILGLVSYVWMSLLRPMAPRGHRYVVEKVRQTGDITEVELSPKGRGLKHKAGQFAFLSIDGAGLGEEHPFTLSSAPNPAGEPRVLRFSIKDLGDYTRRLQRNLKEGMDARVSGPFGHFTMPSGRDPQVWIGAGVGITPFLAFANSLKDRDTGPVTLYYCVRSQSEAVYAGELQELAAAVPNLAVHIVASQTDGRLSADRIAQGLGAQTGAAHVFFCGPAPMRKALRSSLILKGLRASRFHYEEFEMRTGIGLGYLAAWLWDRGMHEVERRLTKDIKPAE